jgi:hypothetical protein
MMALAILVSSLTLQALVQPYQSTLLNVLDVFGLLMLVLTQIISILYLYLDSRAAADQEGSFFMIDVNRSYLESITTVLLFAANFLMIALLLVAWVTRVVWEHLSVTKMKLIEARVSASLGEGPMLELAPLEEKSTLPRGWVEHIDASTSTSYFHNEQLGTTTWHRPTENDTATTVTQMNPIKVSAHV